MPIDDYYYLSPYQFFKPEYVRFTINGSEVKVLVNTLSIDDVIGERSTASFVVKTDTATHFQQGQPVEIYDADLNVIYAGVIDKPSEKRIPGQDILLHSIQCKDMHYLADKRIVAKAYESTLAGDIVQDLITLKLAAEGVTAGTVQSGPTVNEAVFNYIPVTRAIEALAEKAGYIWYIDFDKTLHFKDRAANIAPWTVTGADVLPDVAVEHGNPKYRNYQYIKGGTDITDPQTEEFKGDGKQKSFSTGFKIAKVPTVKVNAIAQTVGIRGVETGKQWYWSKGENAVSQDDSGTPLATTDTLSITYQGEFSVIVISKDQDQIINRQTVELNSGINEDVEDEPESTNREAAFQSAAAKLQKYATIGRRVKFRTKRSGLEAGQLATVNLPEHGLGDAEMLIESVQISDNGGEIFYSVSAIEGPEMGSWTKMFERMATRGQAFVIRENINTQEVLITLEAFSESVTWTENVVQNVYACPVPSTGLFPSTTRFPC
ncbi:hypothetical protein [Paenibacillus sp. HJGM_3]|uniref:hypothetical protein n=1 Tax=Paenibacillus sp. HJGM_3 TaxID=3379816 RepID=UPI00385A02D9